jgi:hypothetical protein
MAVWQYKGALVPRAGIIKLHGHIPEELPGYRGLWKAEFETDDVYPNYWQGEGAERFAGELASMLPAGTHWSDRALLFGDLEGNRVEIWQGDELAFRFDLREPNLELLRAMIDFANRHDLLWVSEQTGRPMAPTFAEVLTDVQKSDAYQFCKEPVAYLRSLKNRNL